MEWSVPDDSGRYKASLKEGDDSVTISSMTRDGTEVHMLEVQVESEDKKGRVIVRVGGSTRIAHVARVGDTWWVHIDGRAHEVVFHEQGSRSSENEGSLKAPMPGTVLQVMAKEGQRVREGQHLMTLEAMKMEHKILAPKAGEITRIHFSEGDRVDMGASLVEIGD
jgi:biotin carboxyl carrier protein